MYDLITPQITLDWQPIIAKSLAAMEVNYLKKMEKTNDWLPGRDKLFNAFTLTLSQTQFILFGESPYPRAKSANGYAFWDANVEDIWSETGLSKPVNRATSLRNFIKMLLVTHGLLSPQNMSQNAITHINKSHLIKTLPELFANLNRNGFLLLNASLVFTKKPVNQDAKAWLPFMEKLLEELSTVKPNIELVLLGNIAKKINQLPAAHYFKQFHAEHPYNISFVTNLAVQDFFRPFKLLLR